VPYVSSCESFLSQRGNMNANTFMTRIANAYENGTEKTTIDLAISELQYSLINSIQIVDHLNPSVFTTTPGTITNLTVVNCANSVAVAGASLVSSGNKIEGTIPYDPTIAEYCIRFTAAINGNPTP